MRKMREYRGIYDTLLDFHYWKKHWGGLIKFVFNTGPIRVVKIVARYRWIYTYFHLADFIDNFTAGLRKTQLKVTHMYFDGIIEVLTGQLRDAIKYPDNCVVIDDFMPPHLITSMGYSAVNLPVIPYYVCLMMNQNSAAYYIDAAESISISTDTCPMPAGAVGVAVENDYLDLGKMVIMSNLPCDGGQSANLYFEKVYGHLPTHLMEVPTGDSDPHKVDNMVKELEVLIEFIEKESGKSFDWDRLKSMLELYNEQTELTLEKWEINRTDYPQVTGASPWLWRYFANGVVPGTEVLVKVDRKVAKLVRKAYKNKEKNTKKMQYRCVLWGAQPNYFSHMYRWLENAWGVVILQDFESYTSTKLADTSSKRGMLEAVADSYLNIVMVRHTKGSYKMCLDDLTTIHDEYRADFVLMCNHISCRSTAGLSGMYEDELRKRDIKMCSVTHDLMDNRTASRQDMRDEINNFMINVMNATPVDESLLVIDDSKHW